MTWRTKHPKAFRTILEYSVIGLLTVAGIIALRQEASGEVAILSISVPKVAVEAKSALKESFKTVLVSCYTGIESHGANGRNPWSVATYLYPQGTKLHIEGFGDKTVETVTSKKYSNRVDVWFGETQEDYDRCIQFGTRHLKVSVK